MIARTSRGARIDRGESERAQVEQLDERVNRPDGVILINEIFEMRRK
jgi:hypothetical protein